MSEILECWSAPWHALQHSLAQSFGLEQRAVSSRATATARAVAVGPGTWIARARRLVAPVDSSAST